MKKSEVVVMSITGPNSSAIAAKAGDDCAAIEAKPRLSVSSSFDALHKEVKETETRLQLFKNVAREMNSGMPVWKIIEHTLLETHKIFPALRISYWTASSREKSRVAHSVGHAAMPALTGFELDLSIAEDFVR